VFWVCLHYPRLALEALHYDLPADRPHAVVDGPQQRRHVVLATLTQARKRVVLVAPPYVPYAPALAAAGVDLTQLVHIDAAASDTHWTAEQCLRAGCCGAVLNWLPRSDYRQLRRLQLAAETGGTFGFVFRPLSAAHEASPAALRLRLDPGETQPRLEILKCRGRFGEPSHALGLRA